MSDLLQKRAPLSVCRTLLIVHRALFNVSRALFSVHRALLSAYRDRLSVYREIRTRLKERCRVLQCIAACCSAWQYVAVSENSLGGINTTLADSYLKT